MRRKQVPVAPSSRMSLQDGSLSDTDCAQHTATPRRYRSFVWPLRSLVPVAGIRPLGNRFPERRHASGTFLDIKKASSRAYGSSAISMGGSGVGFLMITIGDKLPYTNAVLLALALGMNVVLLIGLAFLYYSETKRRNHLRRSEINVARLIDSSSDAIFVRRRDGVITIWNKEAERLYGYEAHEVIGTRFDPVVPSERPSVREKLFGEATENKHPRRLYTRCTQKNGATINVVLKTVPYLRDDGDLAESLVLTRDVDSFAFADQVQSSRAVETRLRALVDNSADALALVNAEGRTLYCSAAIERILGCPLHETWDRSIFKFVHRDDLDAIQRAFDQCISRPETPISVRARLRHQNNSWLWVEAVLKNLLNVAAIQAVLINFRDITKAVTAEEAARKSHERFIRAFQSSPLAISISTRDEGRYIDVNDAFCEMFGVSRDVVVGQTSSLMNLWVEPQTRADFLQQLDDTGRPCKKPLRTRMRARNGDILDVEIYAELIEMEEATCVLAVTHDVTIANRTELQFLRAQRMEAVGRLAGGLAHDLNNVLAVVIGHSEISQERLGHDHPVSRNVAQIKKAADRATTLIRQLLAFSRQQLLYPRILDLNELLRNLNEMLVPMLGEDIALRFEPDASLAAIRADLGQIEQVVMNLVVNARDAMPSGGTLTIKTAEVALDSTYAANHSPLIPGKYVMISVSDTGCGMSDDVIPHIFEPFFTTKGPGKGTGLGLSTAYGIVKQSNGYIWVYSELGKGTTFKVYFPRIAQTPEPYNEIESEQEIGSNPATGTILVVEDDELLRSLVVRLLDSPGYDVLEAESADAALRLVAQYQGKIDLLLTDVVMPSISGGELAERIRALLPEIKVLFMSGYSSELVAKHGAVKPGDRVLEKPFTRNSLLSQVRVALLE